MGIHAEAVQKLYVAYFNRPADALGLIYWEEQITKAGGSAAAVANAFSASQEYKDLYAGKDSANIVNAIYQNLFGRAAETDGLLYWGSRLENKTFDIGTIAMAILNGAQNDDKKVIDNKTAAAVEFTKALDTTAEIVAYSGNAANVIAKAWLATVTATADSLTAAKASVNSTITSIGSGTVANGQTFTLTTALDTFAGTANNDTLVGSSDTSGLGDTFDGGAGVDTVRITSNAATTNVPTLKNVEVLEITDTIHESRDVSTTTGLTTFKQAGGVTIAAGTVTTTIATGQTLSFANIADGTLTDDLGVDTDGAGADDGTNAAGEISIASAAGVTAVSIALESVGAQTTAAASSLTDLDFNIAGTTVTTVNVAATGVNNISLANTGAAITTVNVSGTGSVTAWGTNAATITTVNASSNSGGVTLDLSASTGANQTITGGSGNDVLTVDLQRNITLAAGEGNDAVVLTNATAANLSSTTGAADSIDGGAGVDLLIMSSAGAVALTGDTAADRAVLAGFDRLRTADDLNASTFDISAFNTAGKNAINYLQVAAATTTAAATVNGFASGATVEYRAAADSTVALNVGMTGATGAGTPNDALTVALNADITAAQATKAASFDFLVGVAGINKLTVTTADRDNTDGVTTRGDGYTLILSNDNNVDSITVTGSSELNFTSTSSTAALANLDATGLTGNLDVDLTTTGVSQGIVIKGGAGTNTIVGSAYADAITGGARADFITGGLGADVMTGGAGADTFSFANTATGLPSATNFDTIVDFAKASDIIDGPGTLTIATAVAAASAGTAAINAKGIAAFEASDNTLTLKLTAIAAAITAGTTAANEMVVFADGSDSYVFVSDGTNGLSATDVLVKLTGVSGLTEVTITGGDATIA